MVNPKYLRDDIASLTAHAMEEAGELVAAIGKVYRLGWQSFHPDDPSYTNLEYVKDELRDNILASQRLLKQLEEDTA